MRWLFDFANLTLRLGLALERQFHGPLVVLRTGDSDDGQTELSIGKRKVE
jgi:hypothetical protein